MEYYILDKIEFINNELIYTPIGYLTSQESLDSISDKLNIFENWITLNRTDLENGSMDLSNFFETNDHYYVCNTVTSSIDDIGLVEIININDL
jgi:hypothetical protein